MQSKDVMAMQQQMSQMAEMIRLQKEQVRVEEEAGAGETNGRGGGWDFISVCMARDFHTATLF